MNINYLVELASEFLIYSKYLTSLKKLGSEIDLTLDARVHFANDKPKVLVVEDDKDILEMLKLVLESRGYTVLTADNVQKAIHIAKSHKNIHSLITDYYIDDLTAPDLLAGLGSHKPKNVVLLSGKHFSDDPKKEVPGIDSHVSKPFQIKNLIDKIKTDPV